MGSGKTTLARAMAGLNFHTVTIASTLKEMTLTYLVCCGISPHEARKLISDPTLKERDDPRIGNKSPRYLMQTLGTEWGRNFLGPDAWGEAALAKAADLMSQGYNVVLDDVRFVNEADLVKRAGGHVVFVENPSVPRAATTHASEGALNNYPHDYLFTNDGPLSDMLLKAHNMVEFLKNK